MDRKMTKESKILTNLDWCRTLYKLCITVSIYDITMVQKLSNCEVKVHNTRIYLPLNFAWKQFLAKYNVSNSLCSRNFQSVKLRLDFVENLSFYRFSDFKWNQTLVNSDGLKMLFLPILEVLKFDFCKFEPLSIPIFTKFQICQKWHFLTVWICQNLISRNIWVWVQVKLRILKVSGA